ncbi:unknown [[Mannheimia] succiniciproducens MBEL55E]|uniref:Uncharacterized protein n=1 Tax=Mannheimia succiniciproducens (strain KCTC 0769BP / MBEL55E) TaxID=221988 RepID=Q65QS7_MANSM|nr:unknown [[Mannheimia] succiniciproducens MBEL55E]
MIQFIWRFYATHSTGSRFNIQSLNSRILAVKKLAEIAAGIAYIR